MDGQMRAAVAFVRSQQGGSVHADDMRLDQWSGDGEPDTLNRCFAARVLSQVQIAEDDFVIELGRNL